LHHLKAQVRVLFKTKNSSLWGKKPEAFYKDFIALSQSAAEYLVEKKIALVGIDYLSIEAFHAKGNLVHKLLLRNNIVILEGLNLSSIKQGEYELICLPLKLMGADGSPARALLREMG
jgi:Predicted metal-dependent hydrolase